MKKTKSNRSNRKINIYMHILGILSKAQPFKEFICMQNIPKLNKFLIQKLLLINFQFYLLELKVKNPKFIFYITVYCPI